MNKLRVLLGRLARASKNEKGQSLLEIVGFLVLVGILITVFATRILGAQDSANDTAAQERLKRAIIAAETIFAAANSNYPAAMAADGTAAVCNGATGPQNLECVDTALEIVDGTTTPATAGILAALAANTVRVEFGNHNGMQANQEIVLQTVSKNGRAWCVRLLASNYTPSATPAGALGEPGTYYGGGENVRNLAAATTVCRAGHTNVNGSDVNRANF